jgi:hypothetical protein
MFCLEWQLWLHALPSLKYTIPNLYKSNWQWQCLPKVQKLSLVIAISISLCVWWGKRWKTSFCMWARLFDVIVAVVFQNISWATMCFSHTCNVANGYPNHQWCCERCKIVWCDIPKWIWNVVRKWAEDKQNEWVLRWANNQAHVAKPTLEEQRHVCTTSKGTSSRSKINFYSCSWSIKENCIWG